MSSEVHTSQSGRHIALKLIQLVMKQLDLSSTTITGIPMKVHLYINYTTYRSYDSGRTIIHLCASVPCVI